MRAAAKAPQIHVTSGYNPFASQRERVSPQWQQLYEPLRREPLQQELPNIATQQTAEQPIQVQSREQNELTSELKDAMLHPQAVAGGYIACMTSSGLMLVHARRAHVTILYNQLVSHLQNNRSASQQLLFPEQLTVSQEEMPVLEALLPELRQIGFELEKMSANEYDITALPSVLGNRNAEVALRAIIARSADKQTDLSSDMQQRIALTLAQSAAIPMGKTMSEAEMTDMIDKLFSLPSHRITPDGKTVVVWLSAEEIARRF